MTQIDVESPQGAFDYSREMNSREKRLAARKLTDQGDAAERKTIEGIVEFGGVLSEGKLLFDHGQFQRWIAAEWKLNYRMANRFMQVHQAFKSDTIVTFKGNISMLYALAAPSVDDETRDAALSEIEAGTVQTVAQTKAFLNAHLRAAAPSDFPAELDANNLSPGLSNLPADDEPDPFQDETKGQMETRILQEQVASAETFYDSSQDPAFASQIAQNGHLNGHVHARGGKITVQKTGKGPSKGTQKAADAELTDEEWLETIPAWRVIRNLSGKGIIARRSLMDYRTMEVLNGFSTFNYAARRTMSVKHGDSTPLARALQGAVSISHPREWKLCAPCRGEGCERCGHAGYDMSSGVDPLRVERGELQGGKAGVEKTKAGVK